MLSSISVPVPATEQELASLVCYQHSTYWMEYLLADLSSFVTSWINERMDEWMNELWMNKWKNEGWMNEEFCSEIVTFPSSNITITLETPWPGSPSEPHRPSDRRLTAKLVTTFADRGVSRSQRGGSPTALISERSELLGVWLQFPDSYTRTLDYNYVTQWRSVFLGKLRAQLDKTCPCIL
jgi:hypothetical protein